MSDRRSYVALDWVSAQIAETLQQTSEALDGFIAVPKDITRLRFALTYLHQVTGSLFMLELHAATLLSREMEIAISRSLENEHQVQPQLEAAKLVRSMLSGLSDYLDRVCKTHEDNPHDLMPVLNRLREANNEEPVSEADLFNPDIGAARKTEKQQPVIAVEEFNELIRKLRQSFQTGLIGIVRDKDIDANFALMSKVCTSLHKASAGTASEPLWHIAFAITGQLAEASVPADMDTKKALKQIDNQIRLLEESGRDALAESPDTALLKTLLYSVARAGIVTDDIAELRKIYRLEEALAESEAEPVAAEEPAAVRRQVQAIIESLRQELVQIAGFDVVDMHDALIRIQNTMRIIAVGDLLASLQKIEREINDVIDEGGDIGSRSELICQQLETIEAFLLSWQERKLLINNLDIARLYTDYLAELRQDVDAVKQSLAEYVGNDCDVSLIHALPDLVDRVIELLTISPLRQLLPVMQAAQEYIINTLLDGDAKPLPNALQALAEAISSVDYYLERLPADSAENLQTIAKVAEESIQRLQNPEPELVRRSSTGEEVYDDYSGVPAAEAEDTGIPVALVSDVDDELRMTDVDAEFLDFDLAAEADNLDAEQPLSSDYSLASFEPAADEEAIAEIPAADVIEDDCPAVADDMIFFEPGEEADEEILEIFVEEAREVVEHILEYLPVLESDYGNMDALLEIRRSYHTLKGSGRMVGAMHIGDYAWSVERMMNKVRDGLGQVNDNLIAVLRLATEGVPALIDSIEKRTGVSRRMWLNVISRADAEWEGKAVPVEPAQEIVEDVAQPEESLAEFGNSEVASLELADVGEFGSLEEMAENLGLETHEEDTALTQGLPDQEPIEEELLAIFLGEAEMHIGVLSAYLDSIDPGFEETHVTSELQRAMHTLKGSSHMADVNSIAMLSTPLEAFIKDLNNFQTPVDGEILAMLMRARELFENQLAVLKSGSMAFLPGIEQFIDDIKVLHVSRIEKQEEQASTEEGFADKYTALLSAALDSMTEAADLVQAWQAEGIDERRQQVLVDALMRLGATATEAKYHEVAGLATAMSEFYRNAIAANLTFDQDFFTLANKAHDELDDMMDMIVAHQVVEPATAIVNQLQSFGLVAQPVEAVVVTAAIPKTRADADRPKLHDFREQLLSADPDMLEIFAEEAGELLDALDGLMQGWFNNHKNRAGLNEIKRIVHTIKGGARLVDVPVLAALAHEYITDIEDAEANGNYNDAFFERARRCQDQLAFLIEYLISGEYQKPLEPVAEANEETAVAHEETVSEADEEVFDDINIDDLTDALLASEEEADVAGETAEDNAQVAEDASHPHADEAFAEESLADFTAGLDNEFDEALAFVTDEQASAIDESAAEDQVVEAGIADAEFVIGEEVPADEQDMEGWFDHASHDEEGRDISEPSEAVVPVIDESAGSGPDYLLLAEQYRKADQDTLEIFLEEALELDNELDEVVSSWLADHAATRHAAAIKRILHTLKGGARLAELSVLGDLTHDYESMIEHAEARNAFDMAFFAGMQAYLDQVHNMIGFVANGANPDAIPAKILTPMPEAVAPAPVDSEETTLVQEPVLAEEALEVQEPEPGMVAADAAEHGLAESPVPMAEEPAEAGSILHDLAAQYRKADKDTLEIFMEEAGELVDSLEESVSAWVANHEDTSQSDALKRILHTLKGGARLAELSALGDFTHDFESMIEHADLRKAYTPEFFTGMQACLDQVQSMVEFIANGAREADIEAAPVFASPVATLESVPVPELVDNAEEVVETTLGDDIDPDLLALFVEEAKEQNDGIEECIANFLRDSTDLAPLDELKRLLHTLKGGARLTGLRAIGDLSHDFETFIINSEREKKVSGSGFVDGMQAFHDKLTKMINGIKVAAPAAGAAVTVDVPKQPESNVIPIRPGVAGGRDDSLMSQAAIDATRTFIENFNKDQQQRGSREPVKIAPDLLEDLINLAGENSIGRSRIEEQMNEITISQGEMDATVDRLHSQLRRLEIETEAQIVFRQEQVVSEGQENFDPLEMDRYTQMQQLSKSLIESASDLDDISATFTNKLRDMETLLLQQARISTELQEGLMRCQMVPFSRMVPRLRRIVRQVAQELGKKVEFEVENAEGELDRTILERMVAPLEHMLRNGVDHGIEMPDVRRAAGKPEQGTIILALNREGGEIVLTLRDDGAGVNIEAVRKKAIERGLMQPDANLTEHELAKFILHAGFSTAQKVTQISGRGVGMDVVYNEIKQMGGSLDINSKQGQGSVFTVRLPFTVSVNRALMVTVGTETYAIPLNSIEGIVRVSPYELEAYYQPDAPMFEYAGQQYHLRYMGSLLHRGQRAKLEGLTTPLPVVLIRSSDYSVAVQVDRLVGSREVVVKSLGPQFSMVSGLSGATVLGDGSVVGILDMLALVRADFAMGLAMGSDKLEEYKPEVVRKQTAVMVVDDSVTVRKVTSRLLERHGLRVILAKDGLDALTQLQEMEDLPDIMLLDIEMPRMDGFEVVSRVRHDSRLQHIPITMITSRTGEKHRERALALGASRYMGKPFQDRELLQTISELTGAEILQA